MFDAIKFLKRYNETGSILRKPGSGKSSKFSSNAKRIIKQQMNDDDETTGTELQELLSKNDLEISIRTALRWRSELGWTSRSTHYCQMVREANKDKRLAWALENR